MKNLFQRLKGKTELVWIWLYVKWCECKGALRRNGRKLRHKGMLARSRTIPRWVLCILLLAVIQYVDLSAYPQLEWLVNFYASIINGVIGLLHEILEWILKEALNLPLLPSIVAELIEWLQSLM